MRATDGLQTTITCSPVNVIDRTFSLELSLEISLPVPHQDEHLPDRIEAFVHRAGLEVQRRLFQVLMEKADHELPGERLLRRFASVGAHLQVEVYRLFERFPSARQLVREKRRNAQDGLSVPG